MRAAVTGESSPAYKGTHLDMPEHRCGRIQNRAPRHLGAADREGSHETTGAAAQFAK